jgi:HSP20 family protein
MRNQTELTPREAEAEKQMQSKQAQNRAVAPPVDVYENREEFLLVSDMPGITKDALSIHLDKGQLTLEASRAEPANGKLLAAEIRYTNYRRAFSVPQGIDVDKVSADLQQGVLRVHLPKSAAVKPRQIQVRSA